MDLCRSAGLTHAYAATSTHVAKVRSLRIGVSVLNAPAPHATSFPQRNGGDVAAWCWVDRGDEVYRAYAVTRDEDPLLVATYQGDKRRPSGVPSRFGGTK